MDEIRVDVKRKKKKVTILDKPMIMVFIDEERTKTGLHKESLVIKPGVLGQGLTYFVGVKVTDEGNIYMVCTY